MSPLTLLGILIVIIVYNYITNLKSDALTCGEIGIPWTIIHQISPHVGIIQIKTILERLN
jgi:hypothetical protein